jgi:hypothetical protein
MDSDEYDLSKIMEQTEMYLSRAKALVPVRPIHTTDGQSYFQQWPMTNLRAKEAEKAAQVFERKRQLLDEGNDSFFDSSVMSSTTNKQVANILDSQDTTKAAKTADAETAKVNLEEAGGAWGDDDEDDDLGLGGDDDDGADGDAVEADAGEEEAEDDGIFIPPTQGQDPF